MADPGTASEGAPSPRPRVAAAGVVVVDGSGGVLGLDAAAGRLLGHDGLRAAPGTSWPDVEAAATSWLVARRERIAGPPGATLTLLHVAPLAGPAPEGDVVGAPVTGRAGDAAYLASVVECLDTGVFALDAELSVVVVNAALRRLHGHTSRASDGAWPGRPDVVHPDGSALSDEDRLVALTLREGEVRGLRRAIRNGVTGELRQVSVNARTVVAPDGAFDGLAFAVHDVDDAVRAQAELTWQAGHDQLTQVLNRRGLREAVERGRARLGAAPVAVLVCDVDQFKKINDSLGHAAGDVVLRLFAVALRRCAGPERLVARLGGDEFAVVSWTPTVGLEDDLHRLADEELWPAGWPVEVSCGHVVADGDIPLEGLIDRADQAMYARRAVRRRSGGWRRDSA